MPNVRLELPDGDVTPLLEHLEGAKFLNFVPGVDADLVPPRSVLSNILGAVQLGGLAAGQANTITAGQTGILLLAGGVMGAVTAQDNTISADSAGIDFEQGANSFTATGNDIAAGATAGIVVHP